MSSGLKTSLPELSEDRVRLIRGLTAEPSHVGAPRLGDRTKDGESEGPSGEDAGGQGAERGRRGYRGPVTPQAFLHGHAPGSPTLPVWLSK